MASDENQQKSFYRILKNDRLEIEEVKWHIYADCIGQLEPARHYLVIQDTTQPNLERNSRNISDKTGLGVIGDKKSLGFFLHPSLVVDAESGKSIGFSDIQTWSREQSCPDKHGRNYKTLPVESKESWRWLSASRQSVDRLKPAGQLTVVADREGDISEWFDRRTDEQLIIRSCDNRKLAEGKLYEHLSSRPLAGTYELEVKGDPRAKRQGRLAKMEVRHCQVHLTPIRLKGKSIQVYAVEARETQAPAGQAPIHWRLLTTHSVESVDQARRIMDWYAMRWNIEQVFRILKHKGFDIESSDLETGKALIVMTLMALFAANKVLLLHLASKEEHPQPIGTSFTKAQMACLLALCEKYEGNTQRQKNNHEKDSLQWVYWIIARIGGWKPQEKQAGVISLFRGWERFNQIFQGWCLAHNFVS